MISNRSGYTIIELIFIIIIIGILASLALPKLMTTRDDAKLSSDISNMTICINDALSYYAARGTHLEAGGSRACDNVECYTITSYATHDTNFTVVTNPNAASFCSNIDEVGGHLAKSYQFQGTRIKR